MSLSAEALISAAADRFGGSWQTYLQRQYADGTGVCVLWREESATDLLVAHSRPIGGQDSSAAVTVLDGVFCHWCWQDSAIPALPGLRERFTDLAVLRYRPGKRMTLSARDRDGSAVIVKCFRDDEYRYVWRMLETMHACASELEFSVSAPVRFDAEFRFVVQSRLPGVRLRDSDNEIAEFGEAMAVALRSLHSCGARLPGSFSPEDQERRSRRYVVEIERRLGALAPLVAELAEALGRLSRSASRVPVVPIHGSMHTEQWLSSESGLAIVDFDRAAMGHAELDVATLLAELDYEPDLQSRALRDDLSARFPELNPRLVSYYRAHKHLAKAFKASRNANVELATRKTRRDLERALAIARSAP